MIFCNASIYPAAESEELIQLAFSDIADHSAVAVWFKNCYTTPYRGYVYNGVPSMSGFTIAQGCQFLVVMSVNMDNVYPIPLGITIPPARPCAPVRAPVMEYGDWREVVVATAAHEAWHIRQWQKHKPHSEKEADRAAVRALAVYRLLVIESGIAVTA